MEATSTSSNQPKDYDLYTLYIQVEMEESKSASSTNSVINAGKNRFVNLLFING